MSSRQWLHLKLNKFLLECFGLEPHQLKTKKRRNYLLFVTFSFSLLIPLMQGLSEKSNRNVIFYFGTIGFTIYIIGGLYIATKLNTKSHLLTRLYQQIEKDLNGITCKEEIAIMNDFSQQAKSLIFKFTGMAFFATLMFVTVNYLPLLTSDAQAYSAIFFIYSNRWIIHKNLCKLQVIVHTSMLGSYAALVYIASVAVYIANVKHTCGLYSIVSYRLNNVMMRARMASSNKKTKYNDEVIAELLAVVAKHREAIENVQVIRKTFGRLFYNVQIGALICIAITIFAFQLGFNMKSIHSVLLMISLGPIFIVYIFYLNYGGEQIIEFSNSVFTTTYFVDWHLMPIKARNILLMIILKSSKGDALNGGTMILSLQNFARIMYISWSMAAMLVSVES